MTDLEVNRRLDKICSGIKSADAINTLHACRPGHPWNTPGVNHWRNAWFTVSGRRWGEVGSLDLDWLKARADAFDRENGSAALTRSHQS